MKGRTFIQIVLLLIITAIIFYIVCPKYYFFVKEGVFRGNKITGKIMWYQKGEWKELKDGMKNE